MKFVLIVVYTIYGNYTSGPAFTMQEFDSEASCNIAKDIIMASYARSATCVVK